MLRATPGCCFWLGLEAQHHSAQRGARDLGNPCTYEHARGDRGTSLLLSLLHRFNINSLWHQSSYAS